MPRHSGDSIPKYRKHRSSGQAVVTINGRDFYLGPHGTKVSRLEYDRLVGEWLASGRSISFGAAINEISISELLVDYLKYAKGYYGTAANSEYAHMLRIAKPLRELYGRTHAAEFGPLQLKAIRNTLLEEKHSRCFINKSVQRITRIFRWGVAESKVPATIPQALSMITGLRKGKTAAREAAPILPVPDEIVEKTIPHLPPAVADMVRLERFTGMRPGEVCILRPCDIDRTGPVWIYRPESHKTEHHGHSRLVFIGPKGQGVLLRYLARDSQAYCFRPCDSEQKRLAELHANRKTPLSCGNRPGSKQAKRGRRKLLKQPGDYYTVASYRRAIARATARVFRVPDDLKPAELARWKAEHFWSPNQLRHRAASAIRKEFGLEASQVILGHSQLSTTQIYAERDITKGLEVAAKIG